MILGSATGSVRFTDADGVSVLIESGVATASVYAVQGPGVRVAVVSHQVAMHGHVEVGPKIVAGPGVRYVEPVPPLEPRP